MFRKMWALLFVTILSTALAVPDIETVAERIVGGSSTTIDRYPFTANVQMFNYPSCGGTLINNRSVLTAAHCILINTPALYRVVLGSTLTSGNDGTPYAISQIIIHPSYSGAATLNYDAAILHLSSTVVFSNRVAPARIPSANYNLADGTPVTAVGWGALWWTPPDQASPTPVDLQHVTVNIVNQNLCASRYAALNYPPINPNMICAGIIDVGGRDACQGDSGGPLVYDNDIVVGITSWGHGCAEAIAPGVYARVSYISEWVVANA